MGIFELFTGKKGALIQLLVAILCILQVVVGDLAFGFGCFGFNFWLQFGFGFSFGL